MITYSEAAYFDGNHCAHIAAWQEARRLARTNAKLPRQAAPMGHSARISSDSAWPLRGADGRPFHERHK